MQIPGYRDLSVLGRGGFSTVYRALQESVQRDVALKVLAVHMAGADAKARFRRECATNGRVGTHPNIVTLFDSGFADDGSPYLAMQLCSGGSLSERLRSFGPLSVSEVLRIGVKIAAALQYAHSAGVLHRDIKPENILISDFGEPELADFGISSVDDHRLSTVTASSFTINHAAPEALAGKPSSVASDIYSLCSTLYTLVVGHTPFTAPSSTAVIALVNMVMNEPAPATGRSDVPASFERLLATGLSKDPADRPADAKAVGSALQKIQQELGLPVTEFPSAPPPLAYSTTEIFAAIKDDAAASGGAGGPAGGARAAAGGAGGRVAGGAPAVLGAAGFGAALPINTGDLPPTGAMPAGLINTGDLPPTGALPGGPINTGDLPPTGALPGGPGRSPTGPGPDQPPGAWGAWAAERTQQSGGWPQSDAAAFQSSSAGPQPGAARPQSAFPASAASVERSPFPTPPSTPTPRSADQGRSGRTAWWIAAVVIGVLVVAAGIYFFAIRDSSSPSIGAGTSTAAGTSSRPSSATRTSTSVTAPTTATTSAGTPTTRTSATVPLAPAVQSFGSTTYSNGGEVECASSSAKVDIPMTWTTVNATQGWVAIDATTGDASQQPYSSAPTAAGPGNGSSFSLPFACADARHTFTLTVANAAGTKTSKSITLIAKLAQTTSVSTTPSTSSSSTPPTSPTSSASSSSSSSSSSTAGTPSTATPSTSTS